MWMLILPIFLTTNKRPYGPDFIVLSLLPENKYEDEYELLTSYVDGRLPKVMAPTASAWPNPTPTLHIVFIRNVP